MPGVGAGRLAGNAEDCPSANGISHKSRTPSTESARSTASSSHLALYAPANDHTMNPKLPLHLNTENVKTYVPAGSQRYHSSHTRENTLQLAIICEGMFIYGKQMPISAPLGHLKSRSASAHDFKAYPTSLRARRQLAKKLMTKANTLRCSPNLFAILCEVLLQGLDLHMKLISIFRLNGLCMANT